MDFQCPSNCISNTKFWFRVKNVASSWKNDVYVPLCIYDDNAASGHKFLWRAKTQDQDSNVGWKSDRADYLEAAPSGDLDCNRD